MEAFHNFNSDDLGDTKSGAKLLLGSIEEVADAVFDQQHSCKDVFCSEEDRVAGTLVILTSLDRGYDEVLSHLLLVLTGIYCCTDSEQRNIGCDRSDVILRDLVVIRCKSAVADKTCSRDFLVQLASHLALDPSDNVEVNNVDRVISVHLLFLVDGLRVSSSLQKAEDLFFLRVALQVTSSSGLLAGKICELGLDAGERKVMSAVQKYGYPASVSLDPFRRSVQGLILREEHIRITEAICLICGCLGRAGHAVHRNRHCVGKLTVLNHLINGFFVRAYLLSCGMNQAHVNRNRTGINAVGSAIECVVFHIGSSFGIFFVFIVVFVTSTFSSHADQRIESFLLLICHGVYDLTDGLFFLFSISHEFFLL